MRTKKNCWQQDISKQERLGIALKAGGITAVTAWLYYRSFVMTFLLLPVLLWYMRIMEEEKAKKKEAEFQGQFKEAIQAVSAALNTGYSVENSFREAQKE